MVKSSTLRDRNSYFSIVICRVQLGNLEGNSRNNSLCYLTIFIEVTFRFANKYNYMSNLF